MEDKDSPKDSRKYGKLRSLLYNYYKRMILEDLKCLVDKQFHVSYFSSCVLAVFYVSPILCIASRSSSYDSVLRKAKWRPKHLQVIREEPTLPSESADRRGATALPAGPHPLRRLPYTINHSRTGNCASLHVRYADLNGVLRSRENLRRRFPIILPMIARRRRWQLLPHHLRSSGTAPSSQQRQHSPLPRSRIPLSSAPTRMHLQLACCTEYWHLHHLVVHGRALQGSRVLPFTVHTPPHGNRREHRFVRISALHVAATSGDLLFPVHDGDLCDEDWCEGSGLCADAF